MKRIMDSTYFDNCPIIKEGTNGKIVYFKKDAVKIFNDNLFCSNNKLAKLKILKRLKLAEYVRVKDLYFYTSKISKEKIFWAYGMQCLENNLLSDPNFLNSSFDVKKEVLLKLYDILQVGHKNAIYNHDLKLENFHLSQNGKLTGLDVDNLYVKNYRTDELENDIYAFKYYSFINEDDLLKIENYSFLRMFLELCCDDFENNLRREDLYELIDEDLIIDKGLKNIMFSILSGKDVDIKELITSVSSDQPYLKTRFNTKWQ